MDDTDTEHLRVGELQKLIADRPASEAVLVHAGWDFPVWADEDDKPHPTLDGFVLYLDFEDQATMVNKSWAESMRAVSRVARQLAVMYVRATHAGDGALAEDDIKREAAELLLTMTAEEKTHQEGE